MACITMKRAALVALATGAAVSVASATPLPSTVFTITATSTNGSGSIVLDLSDGTVFGDAFQWQAGSPIQIMDGGNVIATIGGNTSLFMGRLAGDPTAFINFSFSVFADANSDTTFTLTSGALTGLGFTDAEGRATAGITVTDGNSNGGEILGLHPGGTFYEANYNGGSVFANLIDGSTVLDPDLGNITIPGANGSDSDSEDFPFAGNSPIGPVNSMDMSYSFRLTAGDQASGTSLYYIVPSPASAALLGLAGLAAARRRR